MSKLGRIVFGPNPISKRDLRLYLWRLRHYLFGPWMGCSCNRCFTNPRRIVHGGEAININRRLGSIDTEIHQLKQRVRDLEPWKKDS